MGQENIVLVNKDVVLQPKQIFVPVTVGEELEVFIAEMGAKGDGIARKNGYIIFVKGAKQGNKVRIRVNNVLPNVGFAEIVRNTGGKDEIKKTFEIVPERFGRDSSRNFNGTFRRVRSGSWNNP